MGPSFSNLPFCCIFRFKGTGKTHLGLEIVHTLLENLSDSPLIIVCFTNHALDQFLTGILKFCDRKKLIRIGGRCEIVERKFSTMHELRRKRNNHRNKLRELNEQMAILRNSNEDIENRMREAQAEADALNDLEKQVQYEIVGTADVIGLTTTGAAKYTHIVEAAKPKITGKIPSGKRVAIILNLCLSFTPLHTVRIRLFLSFSFRFFFPNYPSHSCEIVVEEAAEVLEAHVVTALCSTTEHLILLGDHLQLRPKPAVYELAKKYGLNTSMFERFIANNMPYHQLNEQHRMRPCISSLLVPHIYNQLLDHPSVMEYEDIKGKLLTSSNAV